MPLSEPRDPRALVGDRALPVARGGDAGRWTVLGCSSASLCALTLT